MEEEAAHARTCREASETMVNVKKITRKQKGLCRDLESLYLNPTQHDVLLYTQILDIIGVFL